MRFLPLSFAIAKRMRRDLFTLFFAILFPAFFLLIFAVAFGKTGPMKNQRLDLAVVNRDEGLRVNFGNGQDTLLLGVTLVDVLESLSYSTSSGWMRSDSSSSGLTGLDSLGLGARRPESPVFGVVDTLREADALKKVSSGDLDAVFVIPAGFTKAAMAMAMEDVMGRVFTGAMDGFRGEAREPEVTGRSSGEVAGPTGPWSGSSAGPGVLGRKPTVSEIQRMIDDVSRRLERRGKKTGLPLDSLSLPSRKADPVALSLAGDPSNLGFTMAGGIIRNVLDEFLKKVSQRSLEEAKDFLPAEPSAATADLISLENSSVAVETRTVFDYQVPGIIVFALLMLVSLVSVTLLLDLTQGHLERLKLTRMSSLDYFLGNTLPWMVLSILQLGLLFGVAKLLGYHNAGGMLAGVGLVLLGSLSSVSLALIVAALAKNEKQASAVATMIAVPLSFLSGAFFSVRDVVVSRDFFGHSLGLTDLSPWTHTTKALVGMLTFGKSLAEVRWNVMMQVGLTVLLLLVGIGLFSRRRLTAQR
ncbi:MAG: ABC transporter permease [Candidatus Eisenbacteria bacterium]|nr:ABC transporter permease [Candidatus Eisenbacteria bacterium]